jgi:hypothetical protein
MTVTMKLEPKHFPGDWVPLLCSYRVRRLWSSHTSKLGLELLKGIKKLHGFLSKINNTDCIGEMALNSWVGSYFRFWAEAEPVIQHMTVG